MQHNEYRRSRSNFNPPIDEFTMGQMMSSITNVGASVESLRAEIKEMHKSLQVIEDRFDSRISKVQTEFEAKLAHNLAAIQALQNQPSKLLTKIVVASLVTVGGVILTGVGAAIWAFISNRISVR